MCENADAIARYFIQGRFWSDPLMLCDIERIVALKRLYGAEIVVEADYA